MAVVIVMGHVIAENTPVIARMHGMIDEGEIVANNFPRRILPNFLAYFALP